MLLLQMSVRRILDGRCQSQELYQTACKCSQMLDKVTQKWLFCRCWSRCEGTWRSRGRSKHPVRECCYPRPKQSLKLSSSLQLRHDVFRLFQLDYIAWGDYSFPRLTSRDTANEHVT